MINFYGPARPLNADDIRTIAGYLGCEVAAVNAVLKVESAGKGFGPDGRPLILNEPHVLYRELPERDRAIAVKRGWAYQKWGSKPYLKTQQSRYEWLQNAMRLGVAAALRSCSWGLGQVMGFNHKVCGFNTVEAFVHAQTLSEGAHLYTMARFIVSNKLQRHLRSRNWRKFARGYNGAGYAKNSYHVRLASAYNARPTTEKFTPKPATEAELAAMIAAAPIEPLEPPVTRPAPPEPVRKPEPVTEPPAPTLRRVQPAQPKPAADHPWLAILAAAVAILAPIVAMLIGD